MTRRRWTICLMLAATLAPTDGFGAPPRRFAGYIERSYTPADGLPQSSVTAILQDRFGYIWIGTFGGLARFDGRTFKSYPSALEPGLPSDRVTALLEDGHGRIWVGTEDGGLAYRDERGFHPVAGPGDKPLKEIRFLRKAEYPWIAVGTLHGLFLIDEQTQKTRRIGIPFRGRRLAALTVGRDGTIFAGTREQIYRVRGAKLKPILPLFPFPIIVTALALSDDGDLWFGDVGGIHLLRDGRIRTIDLPEEEGRRHVRCLLEDRSGTVWAGSRTGAVFRIRGSDIQRLDPRGTPGSVLTMMEDREGSIWIGTDGDGLRQLVRAPVALVGGKEMEVPIRSLAEDGDGGWWAATFCRGLAHVMQSRIAWFDLPDVSQACFYSVLRDPTGTIYAGTSDHGLYKIADDRLVPAASLPPGAQLVRVLHAKPSGELLVGTNDGLYRLPPGSSAALPWPGTGGLQIFTLAKVGSATWVGTSNGIYRLNDSGASRWPASDALLNRYVRAIHQDAEGNLWIGTYGGGLSLYHAETFFHFNTRNGYPDNTVSFIGEDERGIMRMTGNRGVAIAARSDLLGFAAGKIHEFPITLLTETDGMPSAECDGGTMPSAVVLRDGRLAVPTIAGIALTPAQNKSVQPPPVVRIETIKLNGKEMTRDALRASDFQSTDVPELRAAPGIEGPKPFAGKRPSARNAILQRVPREASLTVTASALSFLAPGRNEFRFRLDGLPQGWIPAGTGNETTYSRLPAGEYRLRVSARSPGSDWSEAETPLAFAVPKLLTETVAFRLTMALSLLFFVGLAVQLRTAALRRREKRLETRVQARTAEIEKIGLLTREVSRAMTLGEVLDHLRASLSDVLPNDLMAYYKSGPSRDLLKLKWASSQSLDLGELRICAERSPTCPFRSVRPVAIADIKRETALCKTLVACSVRDPLMASGVRALVVCVLRLDDRIDGCLLIGHKTPEIYTEDHLRFMERLTDHLPIVLRKARLYEELVALSDLKDRVLHMAAHDLRHPLSTLRVYLSLLRKTAQQDEKHAQVLHGMSDACVAMTQLLDDLLDLSRLESGKLKLNLKQVSASEFLRGAYPDLALMAKTKETSLLIEADDELPVVALDPGRIRQVLDNLVSNAVKFSHPGGKIWVRLEPCDGGILLTVEDEGVGVAEEDVSRLFVPFATGRREAPQCDKRSGLGLSLCKYLVEAHGGAIWFEPGKDGGAIFRVRLKAQTAPPDATSRMVADVSFAAGRTDRPITTGETG